MSLLYLIVGPNGAGKTTFFERLLSTTTHLPFINADVIARERWPGEEEFRAYEAGALAEQARNQAITQRGCRSSPKRCSPTLPSSTC